MGFIFLQEGSGRDRTQKKPNQKYNIHQQYAVGGGWGAPHFGSRGFDFEDNSGGETGAGNIEYICM